MKTLNGENIYENNDSITLNELLKENKKIISFVGSCQSGTSFLVNNIARLIARRNIDVAILDMTKGKSSYYIYTLNKESLMVSVKGNMKKLSEGIANGIKIENNLTIYTDLPGKNEYSDKAEKPAILPCGSPVPRRRSPYPPHTLCSSRNRRPDRPGYWCI